MKSRLPFCLLASVICSASPAFAEVRISEFMASNSTTLADEDGQFSDWIEIENTGPDAVNLENWYLTDKEDFAPGDADSHWVFPSRVLGSGERMVVFASSKNRRPAGGGELHTNFQLSSSGEYLALVKPDGTTLTTEFSPAYPEQRGDISYGYGQAGLTGVNLVGEGDEASVLVPTNGAIGLDWAGGFEPFDDSLWLSRETGVGYELGGGGAPGGFTVIDQFDSLNPGELDGQGGWSSPTAGATVVPDPDNPENQVLQQLGDNVRSWKSMPVANNSTATLYFRMRRDGSVNCSIGGTDIASPGTAYSDFEVQLNSQNDDVLNLRDGGGFDAVDTFSDNVWYEVWMVMNLSTDQYEVYMKGGALAGQTQLSDGAQTSFVFRNGTSSNAMENFFCRTGTPSGAPLLIDDVYFADGRNLGSPAGSPGLSDAISEGGDIEDEMHETGGSAYLRIPFLMESEGSFSSLTLKMRYDDGFVAYLNGTEVASSNAPLVLDWESVATGDHPTEDALVYEEFDLTAMQHLLNPAGTENILAIHGLNQAADDGDFLITPILEGVVQASEPSGIFYTSPTPGAANGTGVLGFVSDTEFSEDRGFFETPFDLTISSDTEGATLVYTLDGSTPSLSNGVQSEGPVTINITETTPVRAAAFKDGFLPTNVDTQTYLFLDDIIAQDNSPAGYPSTWKGDGGNGTETADYEMDPQITDSPAYRDLMDDALLSIPTISIVTDKGNLFDPSTGIYQNPQQSGSAWERPASIEFIRADGVVENMQLNAGIRIQGGHTRLPSKNPKHSFRLSFKDEYGPKSLNYDLFPGDDGAARKFDQLILRGAGNQSWLHHNTFKGDNRGRAQYIRDQWAKDAQLKMSGIGLRSLYAHVYINGIYWGMYNPSERASAGFGESYLGGEKEDYDALNSGDAIDGVSARTHYNQLLSLSSSGLDDPIKYAQMKELLDVEAFCEYMIINQYGGNLDWDHHNWYAIRNRETSKWFFMCWDSEFIFIDANDNVLSLDNSDDPSRIWNNLLTSDEFRLLFADKVQEHLTNGGVLTPDGAVSLWEVRKNEMYEAIVAESARWGDYRRDVDPVGPPSPIPLYDRDQEWTAERNRLLTQYFPVRTDNVLQQYRSKGILPDKAAPVFSLVAGQVVPGASLQISSPDGGDLYYTLDGSDPRASATVGSLNLLVEGDPMKVFVPLDDSLGVSWHGGAEPFDDGAWAEATAVGFEGSRNDYNGLYDLDLESDMKGNSASCFVRMKFNIPDQATLDSILNLSLGVRYDDGFHAFVNGVSAAFDNSPDPLTWNGSNGSHSNSLAVNYQPFVVSNQAVQALQVGVNVLSVHASNASMNSSDFLFDAILSADTASGGALNPAAILYTGAIPIDGPTVVRARVRENGEWSALSSASYFTAVPAGAGNLVVSEIMYHPAGDAAAEFLELENISAMEIDLAGVFFSEGVEFTFPFGQTLLPGERVLVVRDLISFEARYGGGLPVAGVFENNTALSNSGERLTLKAKDGSIIQSFSYNDQAPWPVLADGGGVSLVLRSPGSNPNPSTSGNWRISGSVNGNPNASDAFSFSGIATADGDGDGMSALMEYALGTSDEDPSEGANGLQLYRENGLVKLAIRQAIGADDAVLSLESSPDLNSWNESGEEISLEVQNVLPGGVLESIHVIEDGHATGFFRLKVVER